MIEYDDNTKEKFPEIEDSNIGTFFRGKIHKKSPDSKYNGYSGKIYSVMLSTNRRNISSRPVSAFQPSACSLRLSRRITISGL